MYIYIYVYVYVYIYMYIKIYPYVLYGYGTGLAHHRHIRRCRYPWTRQIRVSIMNVDNIIIFLIKPVNEKLSNL